MDLATLAPTLAIVPASPQFSIASLIHEANSQAFATHTPRIVTAVVPTKGMHPLLAWLTSAQVHPSLVSIESTPHKPKNDEESSYTEVPRVGSKYPCKIFAITQA